MGEQTRQGCKRHERAGSVNLRGRKVNSHGEQTRQRCKGHKRAGSANLLSGKVNPLARAEQAKLQEARASWLSELATRKSKLARLSRPGMVVRCRSELARRTSEVEK
ncbi:hypothetical protein CDL15_Pgr012338 [Punica granatum]|uniref:Uncharacterized protein n=1 Tax=Punica granatum TaxID=22663 RepID=A0A218VV17_PUNGR|nr:hypothetical protein CDL15_Pgr012338 [Punica granatum]